VVAYNTKKGNATYGAIATGESVHVLLTWQGAGITLLIDPDEAMQLARSLKNAATAATLQSQKRRGEPYLAAPEGGAGK
jgi:hypothetical protein